MLNLKTRCNFFLNLSVLICLAIPGKSFAQVTGNISTFCLRGNADYVGKEKIYLSPRHEACGPLQLSIKSKTYRGPKIGEHISLLIVPEEFKEGQYLEFESASKKKKIRVTALRVDKTASKMTPSAVFSKLFFPSAHAQSNNEEKPFCDARLQNLQEAQDLFRNISTWVGGAITFFPEAGVILGPFIELPALVGDGLAEIAMRLTPGACRMASDIPTDELKMDTSATKIQAVGLPDSLIEALTDLQNSGATVVSVTGKIGPTDISWRIE